MDWDAASPVCAVMPAIVDIAPVVDLQEVDAEAGVALLGALQTTGFARVCGRDVLLDGRAESALQRCAELLHDGGERHPSDPKGHRMLRREEVRGDDVLSAWWDALVVMKSRVLLALELGLGVGRGLLSGRHVEGNDSLRLLVYPPVSGEQGNRCKEHTDYGSITLLLQDEVGGLEVLDEPTGTWMPVPHEPGCLILNAGSLLSLATAGAVKATKHRVVGPSSADSGTAPDVRLRAAACARHSIAFFVDPDASFKAGLQLGPSAARAEVADMTTAEYVQWRCGGGGSGVAFDPGEAS